MNEQDLAPKIAAKLRDHARKSVLGFERSPQETIYWQAADAIERVAEQEATLLALQTQLERANGEGYILAMAVLQSDLDLDDTEEAARDYFLPKSLKG